MIRRLAYSGSLVYSCSLIFGSASVRAPILLLSQDIVYFLLYSFGQRLRLVAVDEGDGLLAQAVAQAFASRGAPAVGALAVEERRLPQLPEVGQGVIVGHE